MNAWTDSLRQGFTLTMNAKLGSMTRKAWSEIDARDQVRLSRAGITEADWAVLNSVQLERWNGRELLTPQAIKESGHLGLAERVFSLIHDEGEFAVTQPDMKARAITTMGGQQAGTWGGELARTTMQFKAFPITMFTRHYARMLDDVNGTRPVANRALYGAALMASLLGLGALSFQTKTVLQGKDPIDMDQPRFWIKALSVGGGLGIAGDLVLIDPSESAGDAMGKLAKNLAGPAIGSASELVVKNIVENAWQAAEGKDTHWEAELLAWTRSNTPGASVWWVKPFLEHSFLNAVNENLSPGYLARIQGRAKKDWGTDYWWKPRDAMPDRAPDIAGAFGQ
jgi:hypothetical protein